MQEDVDRLRARWTPELTRAALAMLRGGAATVEIPMLVHGGAEYLDLRGIRIEQAQLDAAVIRNVSLRWASVVDVGFKAAHFVGCDLSHVKFSSCYFRRAVFSHCDVENAKFERSDFSEARLEDCRLDFASFRECEVSLDTIGFRQDGDPRVLARVCRNLKLNAMSMGRFADAGALTYLEKSYERRELHALAFGRQGQTVMTRGNALQAWLMSVFLNFFWGYGERPRRLTFAMVLCIFLFGGLQYCLDGVPGSGFWAHVYFSGITFLTIGYGDLVPVDPLPRALAVVEGVVGITMLGMLMASWTKKIMYR